MHACSKVSGGLSGRWWLQYFRWNPINCSAFGYGIIQTLLEESSFDGETRESYLEMKWKIEQQSVNIHDLYAGPDQLWLLPNAKLAS